MYGEFLSDETVRQKICLEDCPSRYPYYEIENERYKCIPSCHNGYKYFKDKNLESIAKQCIEENECPNADYKYITNDGKECLSSCDNGKYFVPLIGEKCLPECPQERYPFNEQGFFECKKSSECPHDMADLDSKLCVDACPPNYKYIFEIKEDGTLTSTICLSSCGGNYGKYITPDNKCVETCDPGLNLENDDTSTPYKCKCKFLYFIDLSTSQLTCLNSDKSCKDTVLNKIRKYNSNECLNKCDDILSLNEEEWTKKM